MASLPNSCLYILICIQSPQHAACFLAHNVNSLQERKEGFRAAHVAKLEKKFNNWYKTSISDLQADSYTSVSSMGNYFDIQWDMSKKKKKPQEDAVPADFLFNKTCCAFRQVLSVWIFQISRHKTTNELLSLECDQSRWSTILFTRYFC